MKWFSNMKISVKLISGFALIAFIAGAIGIFGVINIKKIDSLDTKLYVNMTEPLGQLVTMTDAYKSIRSRARDVLLSVNVAEISTHEVRINERSVEFDKAIEAFAKTIQTDEGQKLVATAKESKANYMKYMNSMISQAKANNMAGARASLTAAGNDATVLEEVLDALTTQKVEMAKKTADENTATANAASVTTYIVILIGMLISLVLGVIIARGISRPVQRLIEAADKLAVGDIDVNVETDSKDEIGNLMKAFGIMVENIRYQ
ncbi:MAG: HAMP domain-containing protein, partial [Peptococcaceae bacterium]|nr:HAMP domain-containing protein [Peptococcaceae bacterium]